MAPASVLRPGVHLGRPALSVRHAHAQQHAAPGQRRHRRDERGVVVGQLVQQVGAAQIDFVAGRAVAAAVGDHGIDLVVARGAVFVRRDVLLREHARVFHAARPLLPRHVAAHARARRRDARQIAIAARQLAAHIVTEYRRREHRRELMAQFALDTREFRM
ncbi:hypothetical protein G6F57_019678 [Rhizopus arrhizus]|nr:hypothetical protein G6F57_019678 [Rhizopus arrhizus]